MRRCKRRGPVFQPTLIYCGTGVGFYPTLRLAVQREGTVKAVNVVKPVFDDFYQGNYMKVLGYLKKRMENLEDAEDLTQDVFVYCFKNYDNFDPEKSSITTWLYMVTNSRLKNYYRGIKGPKEPEDWMDVLEEYLSKYCSTDGNELEESVYIQQLRDALADGIEKLPKRQEQVVVYKYFLGKSHKEIAQILGISEGNSKIILTRALDTLREYMSDFVS